MAMYNLYKGNTGRVVRVPEAPRNNRSSGAPPQAARGTSPGEHGGAGGGAGHSSPFRVLPQGSSGAGQRGNPAVTSRAQGAAARPNAQQGHNRPAGQANNKPPALPFGLGNSLGGIFSKLGSLKFETEDLLLYAILYLMYRESGDEELLIMLAAMFFL